MSDDAGPAAIEATGEQQSSPRPKDESFRQLIELLGRQGLLVPVDDATVGQLLEDRERSLRRFTREGLPRSLVELYQAAIDLTRTSSTVAPFACGGPVAPWLGDIVAKRTRR